ncbi:hypothetical protein L210DRAFT_2123998 [Boletus edulis BED1]|uniref:Uncharacterized protein n=1 Tax=Boletus edulis BED1 TaxID=1328754 RepID=A0AAD4BV50_BOLED|nr:hypothetical protein L210DRAFT_2123998 [Boletus edulis BED1]
MWYRFACWRKDGVQKLSPSLTSLFLAWPGLIVANICAAASAVHMDRPFAPCPSIWQSRMMTTQYWYHFWDYLAVQCGGSLQRTATFSERRSTPS